MIFLFEARENFGEEFGDVLGTFFYDSDGSEESFLSNVSAVVANALEDFVVELSREFGGADFTDDAEDQADDTIVGAGQIDSESIGGHHKKLGFFVEELGES